MNEIGTRIAELVDALFAADQPAVVRGDPEIGVVLDKDGSGRVTGCYQGCEESESTMGESRERPRAISCPRFPKPVPSP